MFCSRVYVNICVAANILIIRLLLYCSPAKTRTG